MSTTTNILPIPAPVSAVDPGSHALACLICNRRMTEKQIAKSWHVEMTTCRKMLRIGASVPEGMETQGCFPVGSECAKLVPKEFKLKFGETE